MQSLNWILTYSLAEFALKAGEQPGIVQYPHSIQKYNYKGVS